MSEEGFDRSQRKDLSKGDFDFTPFEDEGSPWPKHPEAFPKTLPKVFLPPFVETSVVLQNMPLTGFLLRVVRRVHDHKEKRLVGKREIRERRYHVGVDIDHGVIDPALTGFGMSLFSSINEECARVPLLKPHGFGSTTNVKHWRIIGHS